MPASPGAAPIELAMHARMAFETLLADLAREFVNVPHGNFSAALLDALRRTGETLGADCVSLTGTGPGAPSGHAIEWRAPDAPALTPARLSTLSTVVAPVCVGGRAAGALIIETTPGSGIRSADLHRWIGVLANLFGHALAGRDRDAALRPVLANIDQLKRDLQAQRKDARPAPQIWPPLFPIVGRSPAVRQVLEQIHQVAQTDSTVLLLGETGTGKSLLAAQVHELGSRRRRAMVRMNCAAIPTALIESELFGRERGAFTGASARQVGRFELANGSTIFLDEIGDLPAEVQVKLLRVLEEGQIERLGNPEPITVDARIIAATHSDLEARVASGTFRADLFYRLNVFPIQVPALRDRVEDIPLLVRRFVDEAGKTLGKSIEQIDEDSLAALQEYSWPGNIRELHNLVERALIGATGPRLVIPPPRSSAAALRRSARLAHVESAHIREILDKTGWRVRGPGGAADRLGLRPTTLESRMAKLGIRRPRPA